VKAFEGGSPTQRAADLGHTPRFQAVFLASSWLRQIGVTVFMIIAFVVSLIYLYLAHRYWFRTPLLGIALATACFVLATVLIVL